VSEAEPGDAGSTGSPGSGVPPLAGTALDRVTHRRADALWLAEAWQRGRVLLLARDRALALADPAGPRLLLVPAGDAPEGERWFLGVDAEQTPYFAVEVDQLPDRAGSRQVTLRDVGHALDDLDGALLITALALANWHRRHPFSPLDGAPTTIGDGGWTRVDATGRSHFPRTDPAIIVLVHDGVPGPGGRCLLGHNAAWSTANWRSRYSCLAGFVEPGESAEAAVEREVFEEVGVRLSRVRYAGSQAWPFPGSLMLGFTAEADPAEPLVLDPAEIADARWLTREQVRAVLDGVDDSFTLPMAASIAHFLVTRWLAGQA
jgi:NAD+ diphosphatase